MTREDNSIFDSSIGSDRKEIQLQFNQYFGQPIEIEERVFQTLSFIPPTNHPSQRIDGLWENAFLFFRLLPASLKMRYLNPIYIRG